MTPLHAVLEWVGIAVVSRVDAAARSLGLCPFCLLMRLILMVFCFLLVWSTATLLSSTFGSAQSL